jgi:hypothetical protein
MPHYFRNRLMTLNPCSITFSPSAVQIAKHLVDGFAGVPCSTPIRTMTFALEAGDARAFNLLNLEPPPKE